ncbi:hypothetical protein ACVWXO_004137 [Bradyrhizobium sp. LM2.7]
MLHPFAEHGRRRRLGRIAIRALAAYVDGGGNWRDLEKLRMSALGQRLGDFDFLDPLGYLADTTNANGETVELTSELLIEAIKLTHPDKHPPERRELAHRVTQQLLALQPFVFPAQKPKSTPTQSQPMSTPTPPAPTVEEPKSPSYPCKECRDTVPLYYCRPCRTEWDRRQQIERERECAKRREQYKRRKQRRNWGKPATICAACGQGFKGKRTDARFCSATCRQRAHRAVTDKNTSPAELLERRDN